MKHGGEVAMKGILLAAVLLMLNSAPVLATDLEEFLKAVGKYAIVETPFLGCTTTQVKGTCVCLQPLDIGKAGCLVANSEDADVGAIVNVICAVPQFDSNGDEVFQRACPLWAPLAK